MNVPEDYDDKVEHLDTYPYLLPAADKDDKLLMSDSVVFNKILRTTRKTVSFAATVPTRTTGAKSMTQRALKEVSTPEVHHISVLSNHGPTTPSTILRTA